MRATKYLVGAAAVAAFACAAPAAAQYYPGYGYPGYGYGGGNVIGQVLNDVLGNGYGNYGANSQVAVNQCAAAVQSRLSGYNGYSGYGYNGYANTGARVLGISRVEQRSNGELVVRGVANSGRYAAYGYNGYNSQGAVDRALDQIAVARHAQEGDRHAHVAKQREIGGDRGRWLGRDLGAGRDNRGGHT